MSHPRPPSASVALVAAATTNAAKAISPKPHPITPDVRNAHSPPSATANATTKNAAVPATDFTPPPIRYRPGQPAPHRMRGPARVPTHAAAGSAKARIPKAICRAKSRSASTDHVAASATTRASGNVTVPTLLRRTPCIPANHPRPNATPFTTTNPTASAYTHSGRLKKNGASATNTPTPTCTTLRETSAATCPDARSASPTPTSPASPAAERRKATRSGGTGGLGRGVEG